MTGATPSKRLRKEEALREARIGAKRTGGAWYVTRKNRSYRYVPVMSYDHRRDGKVAEIVTQGGSATIIEKEVLS